MASGFFAVLDDIGALMNDVAVTTKFAATKTAGILGDDLAVNAEKSTGFLSSRELPVLWSITKGSFINKVIIVPISLLLNVFFPVAIKIILVLGGFYLAYEGVEKIIEYFFHRSRAAQTVIKKTGNNAEKAKVKSAIMTDFILSVEIVIIALGTVLEQSLIIQIVTVSIIAVLATIGVYGIVAIIIRMDDAGYNLIKRFPNGFFSAFGHLLIKSLPVIIKILGITGTVALILVSGEIFIHNVEYLHHIFPTLSSVIKEFAIGFTAGLIMLGTLATGKKILSLLKR